jgi:hypothetical protein
MRFFTSGFFIKLFLLGPVDTPRNDFDFIQLVAEKPEKSNISANIKKKLKSLLGLSAGARRSCLKKKNQR